MAIPPKDDAIQLWSTLPSTPGPENSAFLLITCEVLEERLSTLAEEQFLATYILVDCRYSNEYAGDHIKYSTNIHNTEELPSIFFPPDEQLIKTQSRTPVFHCEFSQIRGPAIAQELRRIDCARYVYPDLDRETVDVRRGGSSNADSWSTAIQRAARRWTIRPTALSSTSTPRTRRIRIVRRALPNRSPAATDSRRALRVPRCRPSATPLPRGPAVAYALQESGVPRIRI